MSKLKVMTVCYGGNSGLAEDLRPMISGLEMELFTVHEWDNADVKWERSTWLEHYRQADIAICPANYKIQPAKSANRLTQAMSLGKPVICSPLSAYLDVAEKFPGTFLIASTPEEWRAHLQLLRDDKALREELGKKAQEASRAYSIDAIGNKWIDVLHEKNSDPIDIIITVYNNVEYLKLCLESISRNTDIPHNIIISDAGSNDETWTFLKSLKNVKVVGAANVRRNYSETCNVGIKTSTSDFFVILNSDVIVSKGWLSNMLNKMKKDNTIGACGVLSNCDKGWLF